jgi:PIN domain nuclease of toxin-antitoxin system
VRLLLDTQTLLWFYLDDSRLSGAAKTAILDPGRAKLVSPASYWEIAIKVNLGKYVLKESCADFIQHAIFDNGFNVLPVEPRHTAALIGLPPHHKDPFDRLLVAQAMVEGIAIVSGDAALDAYGVTRLW